MYIEYIHQFNTYIPIKLETYPSIYAHSLFTNVAEVSPHGNFKRGQAGIEESKWMAPFDRQKCILLHSKCDHHTTVSVFANCGFFKLNAIVDGRLGSYVLRTIFIS